MQNEAGDSINNLKNKNLPISGKLWYDNNKRIMEIVTYISDKKINERYITVKRRSLLVGLLLACTMALSACGKDNEQPVTNTETGTSTEAVTEEETEERAEFEIVTAEDAPEGKVVSELTGEFIDEAIKNQRPVAVMIDNEKTALPHYGVTEADIVYEMVNSTHNDRVTRLMALVKDWGAIERLGNVRSARVTNCILAMEWNAVLCHDGGPFYINAYTALPYLDNFSGGFSRIPNGKAYEFTEYIADGELMKRFKANNVEVEYNNYYEGEHFTFANNVDLGSSADEAVKIELPFPHNSSELEYNEEDQLYYYSEYGSPHLDPGNGNAQLCFKNVIIYEADMELCRNGDYIDENGYMYYDIIEKSGEGYYIVNGKAEPIRWRKLSATAPTEFFDEDGNEIILNVGKTYIGIVPSDAWSELVIK